MQIETTSPSAHYVDVSRGGSSGLLNREWITRPDDQRFLSLPELYGHVWGRAEKSNEEIIDLRSLQIDEMSGNPVFAVNDAPRTATHWAFGQICQHTGTPAKYMRQLPTGLLIDNLKNGIAHNDHSIKIDGDSRVIRSVTSPTYGRVRDYMMVGAVQRMVEESDVHWKVPGVLDWTTGTYDPTKPVTNDTTTLFASDQDIALFLCDDHDPIEVGQLDNGDPDLMFRGFFLKNSEVGDGSLYFAAMYLRGVCGNRCIWGIEGHVEIRRRHTKNVMDCIIKEIQPMLKSFRTKGNKDRVIAGVQAAKDQVVINTPPWKNAEDARDQQLKFLMGFMKFPKPTAEAILAHDAPGTDSAQLRTVWDVTNQITSYAQTAKHHNRRLEIEAAASSLLQRATVSV